jgi:hypothetical protein
MTDAASGKVPIIECVVIAWRFFIGTWTRFVPAAIIVSIVSGFAPFIGGGSPGGLLLSYAITAVAGAFFVAAVLRKAVRDEHVAPVGLTFGQDEVRLLGVLCCMMLLLLPVIVPFGLIMAAILAGRLVALGVDPNQAQVDPQVLRTAMAETLATPAGGLTVMALGAVMIFVSARLIMANAATIGERKIVFLQTWSWTRGNVLRVIAAMLLTVAPILIVALITGSLVEAAGSGQGASLPYTARIVAEIALAFMSTILGIAPIALGAHLYKGLRPPGFVAK